MEYAAGPKKWIIPPYKSGFDAYDLWIKALESNNPNVFALSYNGQSTISITDVQAILQRHWDCSTEDVTAIEGGNFSTVYFFTMEGQEYVIRFNDAVEGSFQKEQYIVNLLSSQGVPYPKIVGHGKEGIYSYCISERIKGIVLAELKQEQKVEVLPDLVRIITEMNQVQLAKTTCGFGPLTDGGNGEFSSWVEYIKAFYGEDQTGTFWENWYDLFRTTCLERDVFDECYGRLLTYCEYNAAHRHFVHNDCHEWNILSDCRSITGIIDANGLYGDFLIDIATIEDAVPGKDVAETFRIHYEKMGRPIPNFSERLTGARYFKGLDRIRFYAKMGWNNAYEKHRNRLLSLPN